MDKIGVVIPAHPYNSLTYHVVSGTKPRNDCLPIVPVIAHHPVIVILKVYLSVFYR